MASLRYGYARIFCDDQNLNLQHDALKLSGCLRIFDEQVSRKSPDRPALFECIEHLREGDTLVVWRLDSLGRSLSDLVHLLEGLRQRGVHFESLSERIATMSATWGQTFQVIAVLAEFERNLIRERTQVGLAAARARGRLGGRKPKIGDKERQEIQALYDSKEVAVSDIARRYGVSRTTLYKHLEGVHPQHGS